MSPKDEKGPDTSTREAILDLFLTKLGTYISKIGHVLLELGSDSPHCVLVPMVRKK